MIWSDIQFGTDDDCEGQDSGHGSESSGVQATPPPTGNVTPEGLVDTRGCGQSNSTVVVMPRAFRRAELSPLSMESNVSPSSHCTAHNFPATHFADDTVAAPFRAIQSA
jgi:hypothetical protein